MRAKTWTQHLTMQVPAAEDSTKYTNDQERGRGGRVVEAKLRCIR
jgi:hypothetical protein